MTTHEKLESIECRKDDKARRVLNAAPDCLATITANELESGVTLERLESLNVPVYRYGTQITIHGKLPEFRENARPGGFRAVFLNGNGSVGVRYAAIDAEKKALIRRACIAAKSPWGANSTSTGFELSRSFYVRDENDREAQKQAAIACAKSIPRDLFFGSIAACSLAYGAGYAVFVSIGAIPAAHLWELAGFFSGINDETELIALEGQRERESEAKHAQWRMESEARAAENQARIDADLTEFRNSFLPSLSGDRLAAIEKRPQSFRRYYPRKEDGGAFKTALVEIAKRGPKLCFRTSEYGRFEAISDKKWLAWNEAAKRGEIFTP